MSSQSVLPAFHFYWVVFSWFNIRARFWKIKKRWQKGTCMGSVTKATPGNDVHASSLPKLPVNPIYVSPWRTKPWAMPVRLFWLRSLKEESCGSGLGAQPAHLICSHQARNAKNALLLKPHLNVGCSAWGFAWPSALLEASPVLLREREQGAWVMGACWGPGEQLQLHVEGNRKPAEALESRWSMFPRV